MKTQTIHGSALCIFGYGVLISAESGSGKTELAIALIDRGHRLISDDQVTINETTLQMIPAKQPFMHIGGVGFVDVVETYGMSSIGSPTKIRMKIELVNDNLSNSERLSSLVSSSSVFGHSIPTYKLHVKQNRPLVLLVELMVKKQIQLDHGYDAHQSFINLHEGSSSKVSNDEGEVVICN